MRTLSTFLRAWFHPDHTPDFHIPARGITKLMLDVRDMPENRARAARNEERLAIARANPSHVYRAP